MGASGHRRVVVGAGTRLPVAGDEVEIAVVDGPRRAPRLEGGRLIVPGPGAPGFHVGPRIAAWIKTRCSTSDSRSARPCPT